MPRRVAFLPLLAVTLLLGAAAGPAGAETPGLNVFGFSHHLKNPWNEDLREANPGLGLTWTFARSGRGSLDANAGVYADSYGHANYHLSLGGRFNVAGPVDIGLQMINAVSASLSDGEPVVTPYPVVSTRLGRVTWHLTYIPEVKSFNGLPSVGTFVTVHPWGRGLRKVDALPTPGAGTALEFTVPRVPVLEGLDGSGIMWRQNFDEEHGLRLGCRVWGIVRSGSYGDQDHDESGEYVAAMLAQYLSRGAPHGRLRTYWATGLEARFVTYTTGRDEIHEAWRTDLGVEYALGGNLALALEYGVSVSYSVQAEESYWDETYTRRRQFDLETDGVRLALVATRLPWDGAGLAAIEASAPGSGPVVLVGPDFQFTSFNGAALAWQWQESPLRAWRGVVRPTAARDQSRYGEHEVIGLDLRLERLFRQPAAARMAAGYWGVGPLLRFEYGNHGYGMFDGEAEDTWTRYADRNLTLGVTALVGVEYPVLAGIHAMAEYSADLAWGLTSRTDGYRSTSWMIRNNDARLGLAFSL